MRNDDGRELYMVIDVESIGLHGEAFACGVVVIDGGGKLIEEFLFACDPDDAGGADADRLWVAQHIPAMLPNCSEPKEVRSRFWRRFRLWKERHVMLVADCPWPVEARFLAACVDDDRPARDWQGPYPLLDVASVLYALGQDPLARRDRLPDELPEHNPLSDARQSARLLVEALQERYS